MRRYDEEIEVRTGLIGTQEGPAHFSWRRRIWRVSQVETRWLETADWWRGAQVEACLLYTSHVRHPERVEQRAAGLWRAPRLRPHLRR